MWIKNDKRSLLTNTHHLRYIDLIEVEEEEHTHEVVGEGGAEERPVLLYSGNLDECVMFKARLETILSVRAIVLPASLGQQPLIIEPKL